MIGRIWRAKESNRRLLATQRPERQRAKIAFTFFLDFALRLAEVRSRAASLPGPDEIRALEAAVLAKPRETMTPAEIRALAAESIASLREVADKLAELSALLGDEADEGTS